MAIKGHSAFTQVPGTSPSDSLVSYCRHSLGWGSYPSAEKQTIYSTAPADWAEDNRACLPDSLCNSNKDGRLRRALQTNDVSFTFSFGVGNSSPFIPKPCSSKKDPSQEVSLSENQWFSRSGIPRLLLTTDLSSDRRPKASPNQFGEGSLQRQPMSLKEVQTSGKELRTKSFEARYLPAHLPKPVLPTNFALVGDRTRTTSWRCG